MATPVRPIPAPRPSSGQNQQFSPPYSQYQPAHYHGNEPRYANLQRGQQSANSYQLPPLQQQRGGGAQPQVEHTYDIPDFGNGTTQAMGMAQVAQNPAYSVAPSDSIQTTQNSAYTLTSSSAELQLQQEIHYLRMSINDKDAQLGKLKRDLDFSHGHIKQLNVLLAEKKEECLKYQERISDMQTDMAALRDQAGRMQGMPAPSQAEESLKIQVAQLNRQTADLRQQVDDLSRQNQQLRLTPHPAPRPLRANSESHEMHALRQQVEHLRAEKTTTQQEIEMLRHQLAAYKDDFDSERRDRERAAEKIQSLKEENDSLNQAIALLAREHNIRLDAYGLGGGANNMQNQF